MKAKFSLAALAKVTRAALKLWKRVAKYTTTPLLSQGVDGDMAMAQDSRRVFDARASNEQRPHIAFDDKLKLITPDEATLYSPPASPTKVVALANWETAPMFVLDDHLGNGFPKVSADRLLNKCNPFLSGKRRARSDDDTTSDAPTASTDGSTAPESGVKIRDLVQDEVDPVEERSSDIQRGLRLELNEVDPVEEGGFDTQRELRLDATEEQVSRSFDTSATENVVSAKKPSKRTSLWVCVGHGRYIKRGRHFPRKLCRLSQANGKEFVDSAIGTASD
ncbi:unnamed protein product [Hyaloperonospora brassicae]|uniref:RxLR effector candidate protein n=1 Tax=Hyaloperonospora brassicae TaxID=162125 RepID=A0AAV0UFF0_HYABA|nr:unnamed protein product [Hyaloperonospora brassicae]